MRNTQCYKHTPLTTRLHAISDCSIVFNVNAQVFASSQTHLPTNWTIFFVYICERSKRVGPHLTNTGNWAAQNEQMKRDRHQFQWWCFHAKKKKKNTYKSSPWNETRKFIINRNENVNKQKITALKRKILKKWFISFFSSSTSLQTRLPRHSISSRFTNQLCYIIQLFILSTRGVWAVILTRVQLEEKTI